MAIFFRIDDRLIHGQIVTSWISYLKTKSIVVADNDAATNSLSKTLFEMAIPKGIELKVTKVEDAIELVRTSDKELMLICGSLHNAEMILNKLDFSEVNIGNINPTKQRKRIAMSLWLTDEEENIVRSLIAKGIDVYYQTVPTEKKQKLNDLFK